MNIKPNVFLIGVQKSATTSVFDWIAQHPDVCGPISMKDTPFFIDNTLYNKGFDFLNTVYKKYYKNEKIILNGSAHNIYFPKAIKRISEYNQEAKTIIVLRNPTDRAISAYNFAVKRNLEMDDIYTAIETESVRLKSEDIQVLSETTYIDHGYYFKQIKILKEYFSDQQILVLFYDDIRKNPERVVNEIYSFLEIDINFKPDLRTLNKTGSVRFKFIKNTVYNNSKVKKFLVKNVLDVFIPYDLKYRIKLSVLNLITKESTISNQKPKEGNDKLKEHLYSFFKKDIEQLEKLLNKDLSHWKTSN